MAHFLLQGSDLAEYYELLEHTADIRIRVKGSTPAELFEHCGLAMFDIIATKQQVKKPHPHSVAIKQTAANLEELLVNWLNELLSLAAVKQLIFRDFKIGTINDRSLEATATGEAAVNYTLNVEIKAATYHQLKIEHERNSWVAEVIFDV
jgi:SHS2 domain-containing protein